MGHQQITPVNTGIYMVRTLARGRDGTTHKGDITPARYSREVWEWGDGPEVTEYWSFFGTDVTLGPRDVEVVVGPII